MRKIIVSISAIILTLVSCREEPINPIALGDLFAQVIIESNSEPLVDASVTTNPPTTSLVTDAEGRFVLEDVASGTYSLRIEKDGYVTKLESISILPNQAVNAVIRMVPDSLDNKSPEIPTLIFPLDGAEINLQEEFIWSATDADKDELKYELIIFNADQSEAISFAEGITDTMILVDILDYGRSYFWQIVVSDGLEEVYSQVYPFSVQNIPDFRFSFAQKVDNQFQIFTGNPGEIPYQLTNCPKNAWRPRLNPLRDQLAFLANVGIENHLFTVDRNGENLKQVTTLPVTGLNNFELDYSWSPNGAQLIYMNQNRLYKINRDGSGLQEIAQAAIGWNFVECDWSAQTNNIVVRIVGSQPHNSQIYIIDQSGNYLSLVQADIPGSTTGGAFSPDGTAVVFADDQSGLQSFDGRQLDADILIRDIASQQLINISDDKPDGTNDLDPRYSPDGAYIIFTNTNNDGISPKSIYSMKIDGTERTLLFENAEMADWE